MPRVTCLGVTCGKVIKFPQYINPEKYDGDVRCQECKSLMHVKLEGSKVLKYSLKEDKSDTTASWRAMARLEATLEKPNDEVN